MSIAESFASEFACPGDSDVADIIQTLAMMRLRDIRERLAVSLAGAGSSSVIDRLMEFSDGDGNAWRPETGLAQSALLEGDLAFAAFQWAAASAGAGGGGGRIDAILGQQKLLFLDGWLIPMDGASRLLATHGRITIISVAGQFDFTSRDGRWTPECVTRPGPWFAHGTKSDGPVYVTESGLMNTANGFPWHSPRTFGGDGAPSKHVPRKVETIREACELMGRGHFGRWVRNVAAGCLLLESGGLNGSLSNSAFSHPGLIAIDPPDCAVHCGEILVQEATHQHMLVYLMVARMVEPGHNEIFYSPIRRSYHTAGRILADAHVSGNLILYYRELECSLALDQAACDRYAQHRIRFAEDYAPALDSCHSLTGAGKAIWCRLRDSVGV